MTTTLSCPEGVEVKGRVTPEVAEILTPEALDFVARLERKFGERRKELLARRAQRQERFDAGELPDFLPETRSIREGSWTIAPLPEDLQDRRVEITGPAGDRKMVINALNSGAKCFMADFEDALSDLEQCDPGADQPEGRHPPADRLCQPRGEEVRPQG